MSYKIVLVKNKKKRKSFLVTDSYDEAMHKFLELRKDNVVDLPQKYTNFKAILPIKCELLLIKTRTKKDKNRKIKNELGQLVEEINDSNEWVIIESTPYQIEETFYVYGYNSVSERFTVRDIISKIIMKDISTKYDIKKIVTINNKLIIRKDGNELDFVICKCTDDCLRLYNKIREVALNIKTKNLVFMGRASLIETTEIYDLIREKTGWNETRVWRTTTRP